MFILDAHCHIGARIPFPGSFYSAENLVKDMDANGVTMVYAQPIGSWASHSIEAQKEANDQTATEVRKYPNRIVGCCTANPRAGEEAVAEFVRCVEKLGMKGLKLLGFVDYLISSKVVYPFMEICEKYKVPVTFHTDINDPRVHPLEVAELAERFPKVTVIMAHVPRELSVRPTEMACIRAAKKCDNIVFDTSAASDSLLQIALEELGAMRIVWGCDSPFFRFRSELAKIEVLDASEEDKKQILGLNMAKILGIEVEKS